MVKKFAYEKKIIFYSFKKNQVFIKHMKKKQELLQWLVLFIRGAVLL